MWIDTRQVHISVGGVHYKTLPSRFSSVDLSRLRAEGARPGGPPPDLPSLRKLGSTVVLEVERLVNGCGLVAIAGTMLHIGSALAAGPRQS